MDGEEGGKQQAAAVDPAVAAAKREANKRAKAEAREAFNSDAAQGPIVIIDMTEDWENAM